MFGPNAGSLAGKGRIVLSSFPKRLSKQQQKGARRGQQARGGHTASARGGPVHAQQLGQGSTSSGGGRFGWAKWALLPPAAAALLGGVAHALTAQQQLEMEEILARSRGRCKPVPWLSEIEQQPGAKKVMTAEMLMDEKHPFLEDDHMFSAFVSKGIVDDICGYFSPEQKKFYAIVSLGREVCGFPRIVHGGLTAAIIDESFGGLLFALKQAKALSFWGPAYTVHLEVGYKQKIQAGTTVLCTTEVESIDGRKMWFKATVSDGPSGKVYATARALFVSPKPHKLIQDVGKYLIRRVMGDM